MTRQFRLARGARLNASLIGEEREPLLKAANVFDDPDMLVDLAAASDFARAYGPAGGYPGLRAALPHDYIQTVVNALAIPIAEAFSLGPVRPVSAQGAFSMVTLAPTALAPPQRAPHVDSVHPLQFAILHYLSNDPAGGTAFYRHRASGFETLSEDRLPAYNARRGIEGSGSGYVDDGAPWFEQIARVGAEFNTIVVYRSCLLHSGIVPQPALLSTDPRVGRLTANVFVTLEPS